MHFLVMAQGGMVKALHTMLNRIIFLFLEGLPLARGGSFINRTMPFSFTRQLILIQVNDIILTKFNNNDMFVIFGFGKCINYAADSWVEFPPDKKIHGSKVRLKKNEANWDYLYFMIKQNMTILKQAVQVLKDMFS